MSKKQKRKGSIPFEDLKDQIRKALQKEEGRVMNYRQVSALLNISDRKLRQRVADVLEELLSAGELESPAKGRYRMPVEEKYVIGTVDMTSTGSAYIDIIGDEESRDIYITPKHIHKALHGDKVKVLLHARRKNAKPSGAIVEILERARSEFVGVVEKSRHFAFVKPDSKKMHTDIYIGSDNLNGAEQGDKVLVKMTEWPEKASSPFGEIIKVLGRPGEHEVEIHAILAEFNLPYDFPPDVTAEAESIPEEIPESEIKKRRDMRGITTFTIDPHDAKDFDDALSIRKLENGNWEIGVHIADVAHYVREGSRIEEEAYVRATSVYLVDRVVPMLPEKLSNFLCSLRPHEDKLAFSAIFEMDDSGKIYNEWFGRTIIHSDHRFAYEDAQNLIEGKDGPLFNEVRTLNEIAKKLRTARMKNGAIAFDREEVKFRIDEKGNPLEVYFKQSKEANHLIEEFMLLANKKVAEVVGKGKGGKSSENIMVYRIHDDPDPEKLMELSNFVQRFGYKVQTEGTKSISASLNKMLVEVQGKPEANMIEQLSIRSMAKAVYSTKNIGHYGLAFPYYSHFTSPIRRYPDLMVHRILANFLENKPVKKRGEWEEKCKHSSFREKLASEAERASIKYMQTKYMSEREGMDFFGVISGVTEWGVFVELEDNKCEGMIRIRDFRDDYYIYDEGNFQIVGDRTGKSYRLGDRLKVRVKKANLDLKQIDFQVIE